MGVTIREVAARAGVSVATVSRVLNDRPDVAAPIRRRVLDAAAELHYQPNRAARSLRTRATKVLGCMIADVTNPFFTAIARGVEDAAQQAGYSVLLANTDEELPKEQRYLEVAVAERLAGVVLSPASSTATDLSVLAGAGIPVVAVDRRLQGAAVDSVTVNNFRAASEATWHLIEQGCERVAFLGGPPSTTTGARRLAGYRAAIRQAGRPDAPELVVRGDFRVEGGRQAMTTLLETTDFDGVLVANGPMTLGAMEVLADRGRVVPDQVAVVSFDEDSWARAHRPTLSVVAQPTYEIGQRAAQLLLERIGDPGLEPRRLVLPATLHVRASSLRRVDLTTAHAS
ncbi:MAG TPA: LacI family DNA-binding transcriptional regulator [Acidimicrobiales bacterium]|nr:LacI family DNA-binding transcriptional regulator [Acidimicrobiales bacterium]